VRRGPHRLPTFRTSSSPKAKQSRSIVSVDDGVKLKLVILPKIGYTKLNVCVDAGQIFNRGLQVETKAGATPATGTGHCTRFIRLKLTLRQRIPQLGVEPTLTEPGTGLLFRISSS
jgi:hypothetical protein